MKLNRFFKLLFFIGAIGWLPYTAFPQKMIADTLVVSFSDTIETATGNFSIEKVIDLRNTDPKFLSVYEKKKWLFFPVDQIVKTQTPLSAQIQKQFYSDSTGITKYLVNINHFEIKNYTSLFGRQLVLYSTIEIAGSGKENDSTLIGTFYYESSNISKKKELVKTSYEALLDEWSRRFAIDILAIQNNVDQLMPEQYYFFRRGQQAVNRNLYASADFFAGLNFWGIDGELWFSEPEVYRIFNRSSRVLRYINYSDKQAIAIGSDMRHWNYRLSSSWIFANKMAFLLGVNNWKDMKTVGHTLEEIFLFNASMTQSINFNKFDQTGLVFGIGIMEDLHYVIYHNIKLNIGVSVNCAWKF